jgi:hypothetical protein
VFDNSAAMTWDLDAVRDGIHSIKVSADTPNDASWIQTIALQPETNYLLTGWIKTENVEHSSQAVDAGANLCLFGTWQRTAGVFGTSDWQEVRMTFNSGPTGSVTIGARLGFWSGVTTGTAWFDDLRITEILPTDPHPQWKVLVLVYDTTDFTYSEGSATRHVIGHVDPWQLNAAADAATRFVLTDIPALTSQSMVPTLTIRYPGTLKNLSPNGGGWWPSPEDTAAARDPAFDSVIVIWQPTVTDQNTGEQLWIGSAAGLTPGMGTGQMYTTLIIEAATLYGHRNVFKHEWGHSILSYFDAAQTAPKPSVNNHTESTTYVNCVTRQYYVWLDETDANPIPNSIYNNESGFTHDYYSGTTALAMNPISCLGITPSAWATDGPVSRSIIDPATPPDGDASPPISSASLSPPPNAAGWNRSDVMVALTSVDSGGGSGVKQLTFAATGAQTIPTTTLIGGMASIPISAEGTSSITFYAEDNAGNVEQTHTVAVKLDRTAPAITPIRTPEANSYGWNNTPVTIALHCTDAVSGVNAGGGTVVVSTEGAGQSHSTFCWDVAGNEATLVVGDINIDLTAPTLGKAPDLVIPQTSPAGAVVTYQSPTVEETLSGLLSVGCVPASGSTFPVGATTVTCKATDRASNTGSTQFTVTVTAELSPDGLMVGGGFILNHHTHHHFVFRVAQIHSKDGGRFQYWVNDSSRCPSDHDYPSDRDVEAHGARDDEPNHHNPMSHFEATSVATVVFSVNRRSHGKRDVRTDLDVVHFSGTGNWNDRPGYTFEAVAVDAGPARRARDFLSLLVKDSLGSTVAAVNSSLDSGEIVYLTRDGRH